jgi:hypothetical protein
LQKAATLETQLRSAQNHLILSLALKQFPEVPSSLWTVGTYSRYRRYDSMQFVLNLTLPEWVRYLSQLHITRNECRWALEQDSQVRSACTGENGVTEMRETDAYTDRVEIGAAQAVHDEMTVIL